MLPHHYHQLLEPARDSVKTQNSFVLCLH